MNGVEYYRRVRGMSISELADISGISEVTISKMEHKAESVTMKTAFRIATALSVTIDQLLELHEEEETWYYSMRANFKSVTTNPNNCLERYRTKKHITFQTLATRIGNSTREAGRLACRREMPLLKHVQAVADYEGISVDEFMGKYGGSEDGRN